MRSRGIVWVAIATFGLAACTSGGDGSVQAGEVAEMHRDTYAFDYPSSWSVMEPGEEGRSEESPNEVTRLELPADDDGEAAWLTALYNPAMTTLDAAVNVLGADPNDSRVVDQEQVEYDVEGAERAVLQRFVVLDQFDDGYDYHYRFVAAEPSAVDRPFVLTVGVREDAPITIEQVEGIVVDSLRFVVPEPLPVDDEDVGAEDGVVERRLFGDRFAVVVPADWGRRGEGTLAVYAPVRTAPTSMPMARS